MTVAEQTVTSRVKRIVESIYETAIKCGRDPAEITVIAVSKGQSIEKILEAKEAGIKIFGENRVQEMKRKSEQLQERVVWHFIGHLQSNKVKLCLRYTDTVHSVDRLKIAELIDEEARKVGKSVKGFIQFNLGNEPTKRGFLARDIDLIAGLEYKNLDIVGVMAIPPREEDPKKQRYWFAQLRDIRDRLVRISSNFSPYYLSMGMSNDFKIAIEEGATHLRIGTAIFGPRDEG